MFTPSFFIFLFMFIFMFMFHFPTFSFHPSFFRRAVSPHLPFSLLLTCSTFPLSLSSSPSSLLFIWSSVSIFCLFPSVPPPHSLFPSLSSSVFPPQSLLPSLFSSVSSLFSVSLIQSLLLCLSSSVSLLQSLLSLSSVSPLQSLLSLSSSFSPL
jgi:hypothetical protein